METEKEFLTPVEVAERYQNKITTRTLANWRSQGVSPPFTKIGGRILYPIKDLLEWEKRRTVQSTSSYGKSVWLSFPIPWLSDFLLAVSV